MTCSSDAGQTRHRGLSGTFATVFAVLLLAVFPLYNDLSYSHMTHGKWVALIVLTGIFLAASLTLVIVKRAIKRPFHKLWGVPQVLALGYFALIGLSAIFGETAHQTGGQDAPIWWLGMFRYEGLATQLMYFTVFLCLSFAYPDVDVLLGAVAASLTLFVGVVLLQYAGLNPFNLFPEGLSVRTNYEFQGTIGNIDMVSGYLCLVVPFLLCGWVRSVKPNAYAAVAAFLGVLLECLAEVQSGLLVMGGLFVWALFQAACSAAYRRRALGAAALILAAFALRQFVALPWLDGVEEISFRIGTLGLPLLAASLVLAALACVPPAFLAGRACKPVTAVLAVLILLAVVLGVLAVVDLPDSLGGIYEVSEVLHGRAQDRFGSYRLGVWRNTLAMSGENLWLGAGPDSFYLTLADRLAAASITYPETFDSAHNEYLTILSNNGLPALLAYVGLLAYALIGGIRWARYSRLAACAALAVACYAVQAVFSFSICIVSPMFWGMLGLLCVSAAATRRFRAQLDEDDDTRLD